MLYNVFLQYIKGGRHIINKYAHTFISKALKTDGTSLSLVMLILIIDVLYKTWCNG
jgi:hypothetical protein